MIIAIAQLGDSAERRTVASALARLRASSGRKVMLMDASSERLRPNELEMVCGRYQDVVIDTGWGDAHAIRCALIAARLAVVPVTAQQADLSAHYGLIAYLNAARMFNPGLHVMFVAVGVGEGFQMAAVRTYAAHVMPATLASTVLRDGADARELDALYHEVYTVAKSR